MKNNFNNLEVKHGLFVMLLCNVLFASAQDVITLKSLPAAKQKEIKKRFNRRERNESFLQSTLDYSALSFATFPHTDWLSPKKWYWLSADVNPEFVIGGRWMPVPVHITPRYKVRMFHNDKQAGDSSFPVRTPSFMPGLTFYIPLRFERESNMKIRYGSISIFHHSNGQDHPEFNANGTVNTYNGNFSTNYLEPAFHFRNRKTFIASNPRFRCDDGSAGYRDFYGRVGAEFHFKTDTTLRASYGKTRINIELGWITVRNYAETINKVKVSECYKKEAHRIVINGTFITGSRTRGLNELNKRINLEVNYYQRIPSSPNAAGFASFGYYGSDPYNIYYENNYFYVRAGIALGFFVYPGSKSSRKR